MAALSIRLPLLSMVAAALVGAQPAAAAAPWFGRWAVSADKQVFTPRGRAYRTIDIAPCGKDFCGVSVAANGACGPRLFRFLGRHGPDTDLRGHALWGRERKWVSLARYGDGPGEVAQFELYLGDSADVGGRAESMPRFHGEYRRTGAARCKIN